jgi:hypothetical protein
MGVVVLEKGSDCAYILKVYLSIKMVGAREGWCWRKGIVVSKMSN